MPEEATNSALNKSCEKASPQATARGRMKTGVDAGHPGVHRQAADRQRRRGWAKTAGEFCRRQEIKMPETSAAQEDPVFRQGRVKYSGTNSLPVHLIHKSEWEPAGGWPQDEPETKEPLENYEIEIGIMQSNSVGRMSGSTGRFDAGHCRDCQRNRGRRWSYIYAANRQYKRRRRGHLDLGHGQSHRYEFE